MDDLADATGAEALQNDFLRGRAATLDDGLFQLEGGDAVAAAPGAARQLAGLRDQLLQRAGSAGQRAMLADDLDAHMDVAQDAIARHVARQAKVWDEKVRADRIGLLNDQARRDRDDPDKLALYGDAAASASAGDDAAADAARSGVWRSAIDQALTQGQHGAAIDLHENAQDHLTPEDADTLAPEIAIARQMQTGRAYVDGLVQRLPDTLPEIGPAHADALSRNTVDWPDDREQQATNRHLIDVLFGTHQRALQQAASQRDRAVQDWLGRRDAQGNPQTERPPPSLWKQLDADQRRQVDSRLAQNARGETASDSPTAEGPEHQDGLQLANAEPLEPSRRGVSARETTPGEEGRLDSFRALTEAIRRLEPDNPMLSYIARPGWVPTQRAIDAAKEELQNARQRAAERAAGERPSATAQALESVIRGTEAGPKSNATTRYNNVVEILRKVDPETRIKQYSLGAEPPTEREVQEAQAALGFALRREDANRSDSRQSPRDKARIEAENAETVQVRGKILPKPQVTPINEPQPVPLSLLDSEIQGGMKGANYAQRDYSEAYRNDSRFKDWTIDDIAEALRSGKLLPRDVVVDFVNRDGHWLMHNTRTPQALLRAGIPREEWYVRDMTGDPRTQFRVGNQLLQNRLSSEGIPAVRPRDVKETQQ